MLTNPPFKQLDLICLIESLPFQVAHYRALAQPFDDSTHDVFLLKSESNHWVLKQLSLTRYAESTFWRMLVQVFDVNLLEQLKDSQALYNRISAMTEIAVPACRACGAYYSVSSFVQGAPLLQDDLKGPILAEFTQFVCQLHSHKQSQFGALSNPSLATSMWTERLVQIIENSPYRQPGLVELAHQMECKQFVPVMMDLRLDQFLVDAGGHLTLIDLDAFVWADKRLDFVILEYILTNEQLQAFSQLYDLDIPELSSVRQVYRHLLFMMNVLGATDYEGWISAPTYF